MQEEEAEAAKVLGEFEEAFGEEGEDKPLDNRGSQEQSSGVLHAGTYQTRVIRQNNAGMDSITLPCSLCSLAADKDIGTVTMT